MEKAKVTKCLVGQGEWGIRKGRAAKQATYIHTCQLARELSCIDHLSFDGSLSLSAFVPAMFHYRFDCPIAPLSWPWPDVSDGPVMGFAAEARNGKPERRKVFHPFAHADWTAGASQAPKRRPRVRSG